MAGKPSPSDADVDVDDGWKREHDLREISNALRGIVRTGAPQATGSRQDQRWITACREANPTAVVTAAVVITAVVIDGRTLRCT